MVDLCLKAMTEDEMIVALPFARLTNEQGNDCWVNAGDGFVLNVIGAVCITEGTYDEEGEQITAPVFDTSFHVNIRCNDEIAASIPHSVKIWPETPVRLWF